MELIGKQIAIETILGQPPELHYPSWYAAQIEKLPPAPPEYLAEQAGILVTDTDTISRQAAIDALDEQIEQCDKALSSFDISMRDEFAVKVERASLVTFRETLEYLPTAEPQRIKGKWALQSDDYNEYYECDQCGIAVGIDDIRNFCPNCGAEMESEVTE